MASMAIMKSAHLSHLDLNLLKVFAAVHRERHITRAGRALFISQSAVSHSLAKLRVLFGDPLFVQLCEESSACVGYAWARDFQDPILGFVPNALRYYCLVEYQGNPVLPDAFDATLGVVYGDGPLSGANSIPMGALLLLSQVAQNPGVRQACEQYGTLLARLPLTDARRWEKWYSVLPQPWGQ